MRTIRPFLSRTRRRLGFDADYRTHASRSQEIEPACESERFEAIFDEDDLLKVTSTASHTTLRYQIEQLRAGRYRHPRRCVHLLKNVVMVDGHLFTMRMVHPMAHAPLPSFSSEPLEEVSVGALGTSEYGNKYFGHWLLDDVPMTSTARQFGDVYGHVNSDNRLEGHQADYAGRLEWDIRLVRNVLFRELHILDWSPMTPRQSSRYDELRRRLHPKKPHVVPKPGVMLLRGSSGQHRILVNENAIADVARARGFQVLDPMISSVSELVDACADAALIIGVEGSQLAHGFLPMLHPGATLLTLQPPFKFDHFWKSRCDCVGARYAFIVGTQTGNTSFRIETTRVERMLDRLQTV